jgi:hypothetical protein
MSGHIHSVQYTKSTRRELGSAHYPVRRGDYSEITEKCGRYATLSLIRWAANFPVLVEQSAWGILSDGMPHARCIAFLGSCDS